MRVMCVNDDWRQATDQNLEHPVYGDIDEVIDHLPWLGPFEEAYELKRFKGSCFSVKFFVPLSEIEETIIHKEKLELV